jgi:2-amino-4-hydroxy-6-hydroxymethyldihydropteridine diphosphokinase
VIKTSSIYESPHLGLDSRDEELYPAHLNMVVKILTDLSPVALLTEARKIENAGGRERKIRWGPRTIDIDILLYGSDVIDTEALVVPHAGMRHRAFVIVPLWEIEPDLRFPDGASIKELRSSSEIRSQRIKRV